MTTTDQPAKNKNGRKERMQHHIQQLNEDLETSEQQLAFLLKVNKDLTAENEKLNMRNKQLSENEARLWDQVGKRFSENTNFENIEDPCRTKKLSEDFQHLYEHDWPDIWEEGEDDCATISALSNLMQKIYEKSRQFADNQIRLFCGLLEDEKLPPMEEYRELYRMRREENLSEERRKAMVNKILEDTDLNHENSSIKKEKCDRFLAKFAEFAWKFAISDEEIVLDFDVVDKHYESELKESFRKFSTTQSCVPGKNGVVKALVWPCLKHLDGGVLFDGCVLVANSPESHV